MRTVLGVAMKFLFSALAIGFSTTALASTPDGETPAEETWCDDQSGAAFGICNAYCEAMDCGDPAQHANDRACEQKERQYERLTGESMPQCGAPPPPVTCEDECEIRYGYAIDQCDSADGLRSLECETGDCGLATCEELALSYLEECLDECSVDECQPNYVGFCDLPEKRVDESITDSCACEAVGGVWIVIQSR